MSVPPLADAVLPSGIRSRFVPDINALRMHVLEAGFEERGRPLVLLLHGFPELAYSWRKVMVPLAAAGFHVIAVAGSKDVQYVRTLGVTDVMDYRVADFAGRCAVRGRRDRYRWRRHP